MLSNRGENKVEIRKFRVTDSAGEKRSNKRDTDSGKKTVTNGPANALKAIGKPRRTRSDLTGSKKYGSRSLTDLKTDRQEQKESRRTRSLTRDMPSNGKAVFTPRSFRQFPCWQETRSADDAGRRIANLLMLNAWRRRREDNKKARAIVAALTDQVDSLHMQVYVLRQLLNNEKDRATIIAKDMQKNKLKMEEYKQERKLMHKEKESMKSKIKHLLDLIADLRKTFKNQENELATARLEAENWENTLERERKKLKDMKDQNITLQREAQSREDFLVFQSQNLEQLNQAKKELQDKLNTQAPLLNEAMSQVNSFQEKLKLSEELERKQRRALMQKNEEIKILKGQIALLEGKLQEQDEKNGELGKLISDKTKELILLNDKLKEQNRSQKLWGNRVIKIASLCTRIPIACFYTVATLLLPQPSYRSF